MDGMTFWQWCAQGGSYVLYFAGAVAAVCVAGSWIMKIVKGVRKPHNDLKDHVGDLEEQHRHYDECLKNDKERLDSLETGQRLILSGVMQLITHEVDGNHVDKLKEAGDAIQTYLIEK